MLGGGSEALVFSPLPQIGRRACAVAVTTALLGLSAGCYDATSLRLTVRSAPTTLDCARTVDTVFFDAAYVRSNSVAGPDLFYTPRLAPYSSMRWGLLPQDLGWGIGVWLKEGSKDPSAASTSVCGFELEALSPDPGPGMSHRYSAQRGDTFDRTVRDMAQRLTEAFEAPRPPG
jgi:hypothetical protein